LQAGKLNKIAINGADKSLSGEMAVTSIYEELKYCKQFILGPQYCEKLTSWEKIKVDDSIHLMTHPNLNTYQVAKGDKSLTLIGFILDPDNPVNANADIVNALFLKLSDFDSFVRHTYKYGGRWILIVNDGSQIRLFNDAVGLRQVFYTETSHVQELWCASQPGLIAEVLGLKMGAEAVNFIDSYEFRKNSEFRWPGNSTPYNEIKHLLPNHYLNLETGRCKRFWPDRPLSDHSPHEVLENVTSTLKGLMKSASNRFDLALSVTAGLDSRVVLAASRSIRDSISCMTVRQIGMQDDHPDITTAAQLSSYLGLKHDVVRSSLIIDDEFINIFKKNVPIPHYIYAPDAQAILNYYAYDKVAVTGSTSEVSRSSFRALINRPRDHKLTVQHFMRLQGMGSNKFARDHYEKWLSGLGNAYNLDILNLFEWELDDGNWLSMCQLEFDIAWKDIFSPFNCRRLITALLSVKQEYMMPPKYELYRMLIKNMWPDVLDVPINPHKKKKTSMSSKLKSYLRLKLGRTIHQ
jgi:hypothetical protein